MITTQSDLGQIRIFADRSDWLEIFNKMIFRRYEQNITLTTAVRTALYSRAEYRSLSQDDVRLASYGLLSILIDELIELDPGMLHIDYERDFVPICFFFDELNDEYSFESQITALQQLIYDYTDSYISVSYFDTFVETFDKDHKPVTALVNKKLSNADFRKEFNQKIKHFEYLPERYSYLQL